MKIARIKIKNMFGIREFEAEGKDYELIGENGTGKTSVIDAIRFALNNKSSRDYIVRAGQLEGEIIIETDTGLSINRKARVNKADYKSVQDNGRDVPSPESFLRGIFTELQLNPVEFLSMSKQEQNRIILDMIDFKWDLNWIKEQFGEIVPDVNYEQNILGVLFDIQSEDGHYFKKRQDLNRDSRNKLAFIEEIGQTLPEGYTAEKWEKVSSGEIHRRIQAIQTENARIEKAKSVIENRNNRVKALEAEKESDISRAKEQTHNSKKELEEEITKTKFDFEASVQEHRDNIAKWQKMIEQTENEIINLEHQKVGILKNIDKDIGNLITKQVMNIEKIESDFKVAVSEVEAEVKQYQDVAGKPTQAIDELQSEANNIEKMKLFVNEYKRMVNLQGEVETLAEESEELTRKIERARTLPGEILEKSNIPVEGLSIKDGIPLINGLPISNLSDGEKLDLCVKVATSKVNALNIVLVDGVEKLSKQNRLGLYKKLKESGVQFLSTRTADNPDLTVIEL